MFGIGNKLKSTDKTPFYIAKREDLDTVIEFLEKKKDSSMAETFASLKMQQNKMLGMNINGLISVTEDSAVDLTKEIDGIMADNKVNWKDSLRFWSVFGILKGVWNKLSQLKGEFKDLDSDEIEVWFAVLIKRTIATIRKFKGTK